MTKLLDRVQKLIALSSSSFEGEAKSAALKACVLIRENGLIVTDPVPPVARRVFVSKFRGWCGDCGEPYNVGDSVAWAKGHPTLCAGCHREARR